MTTVTETKIINEPPSSRNPLDNEIEKLPKTFLESNINRFVFRRLLC